MIGRTNEGRTNDGRTNDGRTNDSAPSKICRQTDAEKYKKERRAKNDRY